MRNNQPSRKKSDRAAVERLIRVLLLLIPVLVYMPTFGGDAAVPPGQSAYSDLLISHYPNLHYLRESILNDHQIPLWSTLIHSGAPFAANPLAGVFYLPGWIAIFFALPAGVSLALAAHVVFGTWGMYRFLGQKEIGEAGRLLGALAFGLMPKVAAHFGAGHVTLIYAISWTPWLLACSGKDKSGWKTGAIAGMLFLADPRWSVYGGLLWISHEIAHRHIQNWKDLIKYLKASLIASLISAPLLLPMLEYLTLVSRADLTSGDILAGSLPVGNLIGMIIPGSSGNTEWYLYSGGVLLAMFIGQLFRSDLRRINRFWNAWIAISLLFALGTWGIKADWVSKIPIVNLMRVPARSLFIAGFSMAVIAGKTVDSLSMFVKRNPKQRIISLGLISFGVMMIGGVILITGAKPLMVIWGLVFFVICGLCLLLLNRIPSKRHAAWLLIGLVVIDLLGAGWAAYDIQKKGLREPNDIHMMLIKDEEDFRIYSPSHSVAQYLAAEHNLELTDGVDPMHLAAYADFMEEASGVPQEGYSVTIPPFSTGNPSRDNRHAIINAALLGLLNVKYVVSEFDLTGKEISLIAVEGNTRLYANEKVLPRAWVEKPENSQIELDPSLMGEVEILSRTANSMLLEATGPGKLVISEVHYPGWRASVNGKQAELQIAHGILRSVSLADGDHQISLRFLPITVYSGLILAGVGWIMLIITYYRERIERLSD